MVRFRPWPSVILKNPAHRDGLFSWPNGHGGDVQFDVLFGTTLSQDRCLVDPFTLKLLYKMTVLWRRLMEPSGWLARCLACLHAQWPRQQREQLDEIARDLWNDQRWQHSEPWGRTESELLPIAQCQSNRACSVSDLHILKKWK